jgi:uncharacterized LabA/DUF88 family protein
LSEKLLKASFYKLMLQTACKYNNYAYIDGANLYKGVSSSGWKLDYRRFRVWLRDKYSVSHAYIFIGFIPKHKDLYVRLQDAGFTLVFKEVTYDGSGEAKGNCDADLVLWAVRDAYEKFCDRAVLVSSDGDYASLVSFLDERSRLEAIVSPRSTCSILLKKLNVPIVYLETQKTNLSLNIKEPSMGTKPHQGLFRGNG